MENIKFTKKVHFDGLLNIGSIRIGTLKDFKDGEHGEMVSDSMEGAKRFSGSYTNVTADSIKSSAALSSLISIGQGGGITNLEMNNVTIIEPDYYIFSFAKGYDLHDHNEWLVKESYDVAYSINFPKTFFKKITNELNNHSAVQFLGLFDVHYYDEKKGMDFFDPLNAHPAFCLKDYDGFSNQKEIRAVWKPLVEKDISPINLQVPGLGRYVDLTSQLART